LPTASSPQLHSASWARNVRSSAVWSASGNSTRPAAFLVAGVERRSPAERAGLEEGDVLIALGRPNLESVDAPPHAHRERNRPDLRSPSIVLRRPPSGLIRRSSFFVTPQDGEREILAMRSAVSMRWRASTLSTVWPARAMSTIALFEAGAFGGAAAFDAGDEDARVWSSFQKRTRTAEERDVLAHDADVLRVSLPWA